MIRKEIPNREKVMCCFEQVSMEIIIFFVVVFLADIFLTDSCHKMSDLIFLLVTLAHKMGIYELC